MATKTVAAGRFKQTCLALLDEVDEQQTEIVVTKRGRPVARIVPVRDARDIEGAVLARLRARGAGTLVDEDELLKPTGELAKWTALGRRGRR